MTSKEARRARTVLADRQHDLLTKMGEMNDKAAEERRDFSSNEKEIYDRWERQANALNE